MKLLQWNVWFKEDIKNILKTIQEIDPDILCLQELSFDSAFNPRQHTAAYLKTHLDMNMVYKDAQHWESWEMKEVGNAVLTKYPISSSRYVFTQGSNGETHDYSKEGRVYVEATLDINGEKLTVGTTHMSYTHQFQMTEAKQTETDKLLDILKEKKDHFIFTGDLNADPESYTYGQISQCLKDAGPDLQQKTWTTKPFEKDGFIEKDLNWRLDYIFTKPDIHIMSCEILETNYSDHLPILVNFTI